MTVCIEPAPNVSEGWKKIQTAGVTIWFFGHLYDHVDPAELLSLWPTGGAAGELQHFLDRLDGHFALIADEGTRVVAAVDPVRSIPVYFAEKGPHIRISADSEGLRRAAQLDEVDTESALAVAMAGYTIGARTLFRNLQQLAPGEFLLAERHGGPARRLRYHRYRPWSPVEADSRDLERNLADMTLSLMERIVRQASGRLIAVPLSAGLDSRLVVSALSELGARNVVCFSYGLPGNYEAEAGKAIASHLGYPWTFVPFTPRSQRQFWFGEENERYQRYADSNCSTTVVHDLPAIRVLLDDRVIDQTAIVINGNSGDYVSGLHIQPPISDGLDPEAMRQWPSVVVGTMVKKHFRLWGGLADSDNDGIIARQLHGELAALGAEEVSAQQVHGYYEYLEFQDRQSKYVISRQRIYDFLGLEWRLPLWSRDYLDFWQTVPLSLKRKQILYADMLRNANWGGVWQGGAWHFPRRVSPAWMRVGIRPLAKLVCAPFGRQAWHRFERHYLSYWTDLLAFQSIEPYWRVARDGRGARHLVSWHTEAYLRRKGLNWNGTRL
ncbi:asparagine synthase-related protein [Ferrovibrio sp.]|uniref:asparagine synthase-related protein n=1 Tax=Ferrovibrio sp. TaxID=1917215 RepID=UPI00311E61DA